jgi:hypothetical protein
MVKKRALVVMMLALACASQLCAAKKGKTESGGSGLIVSAAAGLSLPVGPSAAVDAPGFFPRLAIGYRAALGANGFRIAADLGCLMQKTRDIPAVDRYSAYFLPLGLNAGFDFTLAKPLYCYARAQGGYAPTLVYYDLPSLRDLGVFKPYAGGSLGLGLAFGKVGLELGASFLAVFYDGNAFTGIVPEAAFEIRF